MIRARQCARAGRVVAILCICWACHPSWAESRGEADPADALYARSSQSEDQPWALEDGTPAAYGTEDPLSQMSLLSLATKLGVGLGLVILLVWGIVFVLKKSRLGRQLTSLDSSIRIVERTYLGPKKAVFLVQIGDRTLALGVTDSSISPLSEWGEGELTLAGRNASGSSFGTQLKAILGKRTPAAPAGVTE